MTEHAPTATEDHEHLFVFTDHRWAVAGATTMYVLAAALLAIMATDAGREWIQPLDDLWHDWMVSAEWDPMVRAAEALDFLGSTYVIWPARVAVAGWLLWKRRWAALIMFGVAVILADGAIGILKELYERPRPMDALVATTGFSFPSGHAMGTAVTVVAFVIALFPPGPHRRIWEVRAATLAFAMALSRTYLRAHWLTDVVTGVLLGAATAILVAWVVQHVRIRRYLGSRPGPG